MLTILDLRQSDRVQCELVRSSVQWEIKGLEVQVKIEGEFNVDSIYL